MDANRIKLLKLFIEECKENPTILSDPSLSFFTDYLESLGAEVPGKARAAAGQMNDFDDESDDDMPELEKNSAPKYAGPNISEMDESDDEQIDESDVELDDEGVVEPDNDPPQEMGDSSVEVTEEKRDEAQVFKGQAMEALSEGDFTEALKHLTEAILCNPASAIIYASRASVYLKMKKPNAAIRDADAALKINPDSAKGYKTRGMAKALLGQWEEAAKDLHVASRLDYDEEIAAVLKKVQPNAHKIEEHKRKYERLRKQRDEKKEKRERQRKRAEAQAAYERAKQEEQSSSGKKSGGMPGGFPGGMPGGFPGGMPGGFPGGMPGGFPGGMPGGFPGGKPAGGSPGGSPGGMPGGSPGGMPDMSKILNDPEMMAAFSDPEILAALQDVMKDPANLAKHQSNPKIAPVIAKMMGKFGGT